MAEKDVTIKREVKESLEKIEKVGQTLINLANLRQLFDECDSGIVQLTMQQLFDFGCTIDAGIDSLYHHLNEARPETDPLKPLVANVTKPTPAPQEAANPVRYFITLEQFDTFSHDLSDVYAIADVLNASYNTGDGPEPENASVITAQIFAKLQDLVGAFKELGEQKA